MSCRSVGVHVRLDRAHGQAQAVVEWAHPLGVASGEVVVHGDDVDALAFEGVQVSGQGGDQGLAFAGDHLGDVAAVQDHPAHELDVVVPHLEEPVGLPLGRRRTPRGGCRRESGPRRAAGGNRPSWPARSSSPRSLERWLHLVDPGHDRAHPADLPLVRVAEQAHQPVRRPLCDRRWHRVGRLIPNVAEQFHCRSGLAPVIRLVRYKSILTIILHRGATIGQADQTPVSRSPTTTNRTGSHRFFA